MTPQSHEVVITTVSDTTFHEKNDLVATEEPLEIRLRSRKSEPVSLAITMRTPGNDRELAVGFLWSEGIIDNPDQILQISEAGPIQPGGWRNIVSVTVEETVMRDIGDSPRRFYMTSSCGICGKASLEAIEAQSPFVLNSGNPIWSPQIIHQLPDKLRAAQATFERTGGLHAGGLFDTRGELFAVREDVGRHNAVDKLIGYAAQEEMLPLSSFLLLVSGRASFELVQKAIMAGIPALCAVGAPSSLAVALAKDSGMTLLGFARGNRFNIYSGAQRIQRNLG